MRLSAFPYALVLCGSLAGCVADQGDESFVYVNDLAFDVDDMTGQLTCTPDKMGAFHSRLEIGFTQDALVCSLFESRVVAADDRASLRTIFIQGTNIKIDVGQVVVENPIDATVQVMGAESSTEATALFSSSLPPNGGIAVGVYEVIPADIMADIRAAAIGVVNDPNVTVRVEVLTTQTAFGEYYGDQIESTPFQLPVIISKPASCGLSQAFPVFTCDPAFGENTTTCAVDCFCGDGVCNPLDETIASCPTDCACGNGICETAIGETFASCPTDCKCGNLICEPQFGEDINSCPSDCTPP